MIFEIYDENNLDDKKVSLKIWKKIAVEECVQYLTYSLNKSRFDFSAGEKKHIKLLKIFLIIFSITSLWYNLVCSC